MPTYFQIRRLKTTKKKPYLHKYSTGRRAASHVQIKQTRTYYFSVEAGIVTSELRMRRKRITRALDDTTTTEIDIHFRTRESETDIAWAFLLRSLYPINGQWASKWAGPEWCRLIGIELKWCIDECGAQAQRIVIVNIVDYLFYIYVWWLNKFSWAIFFFWIFVDFLFWGWEVLSLGSAGLK